MEVVLVASRKDIGKARVRLVLSEQAYEVLLDAGQTPSRQLRALADLRDPYRDTFFQGERLRALLTDLEKLKTAPELDPMILVEVEALWKLCNEAAKEGVILCIVGD
jgi:hypothetical protein